MILSSCGKTHVGMKRSHNEDCLRIFRDENLYVVADGMGGHASGEVASEMSADTIAAFFRATSLDEDITWPYKYDYAQTYQENRIRVGVEMSNQRIFQSAVYDMKLKGMGTTMVAITFYDNKFSVGHVGDSRVYLIREGELEQVTEDHSLLNDYIKLRPEGMTQEEIDAFPHKNVIVRALGMKDQVEVDVITREVTEGDVILLCSDGLSGMLTDQEMLTSINRASRDAGGVLNIDLEAVCNQLIDEANRNGGNDNITVLLVRCEPAEGSGGYNLDPTAELSSIISEVHQLESSTQTQSHDVNESKDSPVVSSEIKIERKNPFEPAWASQSKSLTHATTSSKKEKVESTQQEQAQSNTTQLAQANTEVELNSNTPEVAASDVADSGPVNNHLKQDTSELVGVESNVDGGKVTNLEVETSAQAGTASEDMPPVDESMTDHSQQSDEPPHPSSSAPQVDQDQPILTREFTAEFHAPPQDIMLHSPQGESVLISPQATQPNKDREQPDEFLVTIDTDPVDHDHFEDLATLVVHQPPTSDSPDRDTSDQEDSASPESIPQHISDEPELGMSTVRMLPPDIEKLIQEDEVKGKQEIASTDHQTTSEPTMRAHPTPLKNISHLDPDIVAEQSTDED